MTNCCWLKAARSFIRKTTARRIIRASPAVSTSHSCPIRRLSPLCLETRNINSTRSSLRRRAKSRPLTLTKVWPVITNGASSKVVTCLATRPLTAKESLSWQVCKKVHLWAPTLWISSATPWSKAPAAVISIALLTSCQGVLSMSLLSPYCKSSNNNSKLNLLLNMLRSSSRPHQGRPHTTVWSNFSISVCRTWVTLEEQVGRAAKSPLHRPITRESDREALTASPSQPRLRNWESRYTRVRRIRIATLDRSSAGKPWLRASL